LIARKRDMLVSRCRVSIQTEISIIHRSSRSSAPPPLPKSSTSSEDEALAHFASSNRSPSSKFDAFGQHRMPRSVLSQPRDPANIGLITLLPLKGDPESAGCQASHQFPAAIAQCAGTDRCGHKSPRRFLNAHSHSRHLLLTPVSSLPKLALHWTAKDPQARGLLPERQVPYIAPAT
jgi:hypothetical protein